MSQVTYAKLIATVVPCLAKETILSKLINFVNVFRVNVADRPFDDYQKKYIDTIVKLDNSKTILLETKGEEVISQNMKPFECKENATVTVQFSELKEEDTDVLYVNYPYLHDVPEDAELGFEDSPVVLRVESSKDGVLTCVVKCGGVIDPHRLLTFTGYKPKLSFLSEKDKKNIIWGLQYGVNMLMASAVKKPEDIFSIREFLDQNGGEGVKIWVRLHTPEAYKKLPAIIEAADGIVLSHGPLDTFVPHCKEDSFSILEKVKLQGKPFILSIDKETYKQKNFKAILQQYVDYGVDTFVVEEDIVCDEELQDTIIKIQTMISECSIHTNQLDRVEAFGSAAIANEDEENYLIYRAYKATQEMAVKAIVCYTETGRLAAKLAALRPALPIIVFTKSDPVYRYVNMLWGVRGYKISQTFDYENFKRIGKEMIRILFKGSISLDDKILVIQIHETEGSKQKQGYVINGIELYKFKNM